MVTLLAMCVDWRSLTPGGTPAVRSVNLGNGEIDYGAYLDSFEDADLEIAGSTATYSASLTFDASFFDAIDETSAAEEKTAGGARFTVAYDYDLETVTISAVIDTPDGQTVLDTISGKIFKTESGETDAYLLIEDEIFLLSELASLSVIDNAGFFSQIAAAAKRAADAAAAAARAAAEATAAAIRAAAAALEAAAKAATALVKSISEQIADLANAALAKIVSGALSADDLAMAFAAAKIEQDKSVNITLVDFLAQWRAKREETLNYLKNLPAATNELKRTLSDDSVPLIYKIVAVVVKSGVFEEVASLLSDPNPNAAHIIATVNYVHNKELDESKVLDDNGFINDQSVCTEWKAGVWSLNKNGCGYISFYNYFKLAGKPKSLADLIFDIDISATTNFLGAFGLNPYECNVLLGAYGVEYTRYDSAETLQNAAEEKENCRILLSFVWINDELYQEGGIITLLPYIATGAIGAHTIIVDKVGNDYTSYNNQDDGEYQWGFFDLSYIVFMTGYILP
ncbi:MAG: hypothetical protein LBP62_01875 [Clostridiales bacterium]|jgi:hypothetical protein|nr:hypothetical protein [Clostridiales bacterium]